MTVTPRREPVHVAIRASAGSGKTFQLTGRYLRLLLEGERPARILATTFTRKAAGEILGRVLTRLARAATSDDAAANLAAELGVPVTRTEAGALLSRLGAELHRLRICTIDAFFGSLARNFAPELGLPAGWTIGDDVTEATVRARAIEALLDERPEHVLTLLRLLRGGDLGRDVASAIQRTVEELHALYRSTEAAAWRRLDAPPVLDPDAVEALLDELEACLPTGKDALDQAVRKTVACARDGDWSGLGESKLVPSVLHGDGRFGRAPVPPRLVDPLRRLGEHARRVLLRRLVDKTEAAHALLAAYDRHLRAARARAGILRFDDVTHALATCERLGVLDEVYFRLDGRIAHLLLDEFQDTSALQWRVLRPFAQEVASVSDGTRSFLAVGDVKQAIYRWRGGSPEIFERLGEELPGVVERSLNESHRSCPVVIDTVNRVFGRLSDSALLTAPSASAQAEGARRWLAAFSPHRTARTGLRGHVRLRVAPEPLPGETLLDATVRAACDQVAELSRTLQNRSIAVLVRRNETVARVVWHLRARNVATSEEGGTPLVDSPAVTAVCALLRLAEHPGDETARFLVAHSPLAARSGLRPDDSPSMAAAAAARAASELRADLAAYGYAQVVYALCARVAPASDARDARRLAQFVDRAARFDSERDRLVRVGVPRGLRISEFLKSVETERVDDPTAAAVRVMTVHQAKGLEFDVVVLPELDVSLVNTRGTPMLVSEGARPSEVRAVVAAPTRRGLALLAETEGVDVAALREEDRARQARESLSLLYVALTRAVHALELWVAPKPERERTTPVTWGTLLCEALGGADWKLARETPGATVAAFGDAQWFAVTQEDRPPATPPPPLARAGVEAGPTPAVVEEGAGRGAEAATVVGAPPVTLAPRLRLSTGGPRRRSLGRTSPTGRKEAGSVEIARHLTPSAAAALTRGTALHAMLEQVVWLDVPVDGARALGRRSEAAPGVPGDPVLRAAARHAGVRPSDLEKLLDELHAMLREPETALTLSRAPYERELGLRVEAERELPFALREEDDVVVGSIDRLVIRYDEDGRAVDAEVIDFKSDEVRGDDAALAARVESYRVQMATYRAAVARLFGLAQARVRAKLVFLAAGRVVALDD